MENNEDFMETIKQKEYDINNSKKKKFNFK